MTLRGKFSTARDNLGRFLVESIVVKIVTKIVTTLEGRITSG